MRVLGILLILFLVFHNGLTQERKIRNYTHHTINGFRNPFPGFKDRDKTDYLKMVVWDRLINSGKDSLGAFPLKPVQNDGAYLRSHSGDFTVTWIGHSTVLIQMEGLNILTDPNWNDHAAPVKFLGPKRLIPPGMKLSHLPGIDIVLISHDHHDHLDRKTIEKLGNDPLYLVPLGVGAFLESWGITHYEELDWWDGIKINNIRFVSTPAQHFSGRNIFGRNKTLWCGWVAVGKEKRVYFAGDTGYFPGFREIGETFGPIDLAILPIGGYQPRWYNEHVYMDPGQAIDAFSEVNGRVFVPIHWGTFRIGEEPVDEPLILLNKEILNRKLNPEAFLILQPGETHILEKTVQDAKDLQSEIKFSEGEF